MLQFNTTQLSALNKPLRILFFFYQTGASSKDKDHIRQHEQKAGFNIKRPYHHFKLKLHKGHRHRLKGKKRPPPSLFSCTISRKTIEYSRGVFWKAHVIRM